MLGVIPGTLGKLGFSVRLEDLLRHSVRPALPVVSLPAAA